MTKGLLGWLASSTSEVSGSRGMFKKNELEWLYRDVRCGRLHPANSLVAHEAIGQSAFGILGEEGWRWG